MLKDTVSCPRLSSRPPRRLRGIRQKADTVADAFAHLLYFYLSADFVQQVVVVSCNRWLCINTLFVCSVLRNAWNGDWPSFFDFPTRSFYFGTNALALFTSHVGRMSIGSTLMIMFRYTFLGFVEIGWHKCNQPHSHFSLRHLRREKGLKRSERLSPMLYLLWDPHSSISERSLNLIRHGSHKLMQISIRMSREPWSMEQLCVCRSHSCPQPGWIRMRQQAHSNMQSGPKRNVPE